MSWKLTNHSIVYLRTVSYVAMMPLSEQAKIKTLNTQTEFEHDVYV